MGTRVMKNLISEAQKLYNQNKLDAALKIAKQIIHKDSGNLDALLIKANVLYRLGSKVEAIDCFIEADNTYPGNPVILHNLGYQMLSTETAESALEIFSGLLASDENDVDALVGKGRALELLGRQEEVIQTYSSALEILHPCKYFTSTFDSQPLPSRALTIENKYTFNKLSLFGDITIGASLIGVSTDSKFFIKIALKEHPEKSNSPLEEFTIMRELNELGCVTCPSVYTYGVMTGDTFSQIVDEEILGKVDNFKEKSFKYIIQQYIPAEGAIPLPDLILAILEQKACGIYHGDIKAENIRFDAQTGRCYLIDYDQSIHLTPQVRSMDNVTFFQWVNEWSRTRYAKWNFPHFMAYFSGFDFDKSFWPLFKDGALNLATTRLFSNQITTAASHGIYHSIHSRDIWIDGERDLKSRQAMLDTIDFHSKEKVLDIGCGSGILSFYLFDRGCQVTGYELDPEVLRGARIVAKILSKEITFHNVDLDVGDPIGTYDTIMLFSVIHHTKNMQENCSRIARACNRIIIECRLQEGGLKPQKGQWEPTSGWDYPNLEAMCNGLEKLFPGFTYTRNLGEGDRSRYILEFLKDRNA
jgi:tetratricopeptide (TPR) repeat protein/SAM-dependent methyltransferase